MNKLEIKYYLHSSKENNSYQWNELTGQVETPDDWRYAFYEVEFYVEVDLDTGKYKILKVDFGNGQKVDLADMERKSEILNALEHAGVDNWSGYEYAMEILDGNI